MSSRPGYIPQLLALFLGGFFGALLSVPALRAIEKFVVDLNFLPKSSPPAALLISYLSTMVILLLALMPIILGLSYLYIRGASEDHARSVAESTSKDRVETEISSLRHRVDAQQTNALLQMSDFLLPIVKEQTEQYLNERRTAEHQASATEHSTSTTDSIYHWLDELYSRGHITNEEFERLATNIPRNSPERG